MAAAWALSLADFLRGGSLGASSPLAGRFRCCASLAARRAGAPVVAAAALDFLWGPEENERAGARRAVASAPPGHDYRENNVSFAFRGRPELRPDRGRSS